MEIAVIGATGRTGREVVGQGLLRGHRVLAVARRPEAIARAHARRPEAIGPGAPALRVVAADALVADALDEALAGVQAVVSTLGTGASRTATELYSRGTANLLAAMASHSISRLVVISAAPAGPRAEQSLVERRVLMPLLELAFGATYADMRRMEAALAASQVNWVALRPPRLVDRPATGAYRLQPTPPAHGRTVTYADLATAALDAAEREQPDRQAHYIAN